MNTDARIARQAITFTLGGLITLLFLYYVGLLTPGNAMKDYYDLKWFGSFILIELLCFVVEQLIVHLSKDEKEKEQIHFQKWRVEVTKLLYSDSLSSVKYKECCELMDKICKDKHLSLEYKKELYDRICLVWAEVDEDKRCIVYHPVPPEIQVKWKKAQAEDKLRQLKKDF